jgi:hypothetical protein
MDWGTWAQLLLLGLILEVAWLILLGISNR